MDEKGKVKELYSVMVDKLYSYFVENKGEAKVDTIVDILEMLTPLLEKDKEKDPKQEKEQEEYLI